MNQPSAPTPTRHTMSGLERASIIIGILAILILFTYGVLVLPGITDFHFSYYALIPAAGLISNIILLVLINVHRARLGNVFWFTLFLGSLLYTGTGELMQHLSASETTVVFWRSLSAVGGAFTPLMVLLFVVSQVRPQILERKLMPWLALFSGALTVFFFMLVTNLIYDHIPAHALHFNWGLEINVPSIGGIIYLLWIFSLVTLSVVLVIKHYRQQVVRTQRIQARFFVIGTLTLVVGAFTTDLFLPLALNINIVPMGMIESSIMAALYGYGLLRYNLFVINPATVAPNILRTMAEAVIVTDANYRILFSNLQAKQLLGDVTHSTIGAALWVVFKPADWTSLRTTVERGVTAGQTVKLEDIALISGRRTLAFVDLSVSQVMDDEGKLAGIVWVLNDISNLKEANAQLAKEKASVERKVIERTHELTEAQAQLVASVRSLPFGFALIDADRQIILHNQALTTLADHPIPAGGRASRQAFQDIAASFRSAIDLADCIKQAQTKRQPLQRSIALGSHFYRFFFVPVLVKADTGAETSIGTVLLMEDITEAKALERSRDEFFSIASHELRTPLTAIRGNAAMILDYFQDQLKEPNQLKATLTDIHDASLRLIDIVNDFLDMSRLEQGRIAFKLAPLDLAQLSRDVIHEYDLSGSRRKLKLSVSIDGTIPLALADTNRTRQILINLVSNGLKFTQSGGITISLQAAKRMISVSVTDTGQGIPVNKQHLLFHKFQQAGDNILTRDDTNSTGLGLYISRLMAEGMKGKLYLQRSEVGKGSTFTLELPVATAAAIAKATAAAKSGPPSIPAIVSAPTTGVLATASAPDVPTSAAAKPSAS